MYESAKRLPSVQALLGDEHTGESRLSGGEYTEESQLPSG